MTHAFFKALLFLAAGSVIIAMHHEQDMRKMGGLRSTCPSPTGPVWIGSLALIGFPFFAGFYSKDAIIEAVGESHRWGAGVRVLLRAGGVFVTALYDAPFWIAFAGFAVATYIWLFNPASPTRQERAAPIYTMLSHKYWIDEIYQAVFARGGIALGRGCGKAAMSASSTACVVNGSAAFVERVADIVRWLQSGYLYTMRSP
jgi:NADH:ubiquinone oxidoreductase subunit 5 (subunit L)/multisubunit Na+/H+ antiporter MnhA subunit